MINFRILIFKINKNVFQYTLFFHTQVYINSIIDDVKWLIGSDNMGKILYDSDYFDLVLVDTNCASTGYMVWSYLQYKNFTEYNQISLDALYSALITDTGSFRFNSTDSNSHKMAGFLIDKGVKPYNVYEKIYERRSLDQINLLSESIKNLKFSFKNQVCGVIISKEIQKKAGSSYEHVEGFTDFFRSINNVQVAYCIVEQNHSFRINFRSRGKYIINDIAISFGGGGHKLAAGATVNNLDINAITKTSPNPVKTAIGIRVNRDFFLLFDSALISCFKFLYVLLDKTINIIY